MPQLREHMAGLTDEPPPCPLSPPDDEAMVLQHVHNYVIMLTYDFRRATVDEMVAAERVRFTSQLAVVGRLDKAAYGSLAHDDYLILRNLAR